MYVRQTYKMEMCMEEENEDTSDDDERTNIKDKNIDNVAIKSSTTQFNLRF
jgi:hypothetical protein